MSAPGWPKNPPPTIPRPTYEGDSSSDVTQQQGVEALNGILAVLQKIQASLAKLAGG